MKFTRMVLYILALSPALLISGCATDNEIPRGRDGRQEYVCRETLQKALANHVPVPAGHLYPGSIDNLTVHGGNTVNVFLKSHLTSNKLQARVTLKVDGEEIESGILEIPPEEEITFSYSLPSALHGKHKIEAAIDFKKPEDLPAWEKDMDFSFREISKEYVVFKPRETGKIVRVGIFNGLGARNTKEYINRFENAEADIIDSLATAVIDEYDCLFIANSDAYDEQEYFGNLPVYVREGGRGIIFQHAMLGRPAVGNNPFGERTPFPEIVPRMAERVETFEIIISARHPAVGNTEPGTKMKHMYYDHIVPEPGPEAEVIVKNKQGNPVVAVGGTGAGRVIFDGNINLDSSGAETDLDGFNAHIARHAVEWFSGVKLRE